MQAVSLTGERFQRPHRLRRESASRLSDLLKSDWVNAATGECLRFMHRNPGHSRAIPTGEASEATSGPREALETKTDIRNRLGDGRLGMATSLFTPCEQNTRRPRPQQSSACPVVLGMVPSDSTRERSRDRIEVAALLHEHRQDRIPIVCYAKTRKTHLRKNRCRCTCVRDRLRDFAGLYGDQTLARYVRYNSTWFESRRQDDSMRGMRCLGRAHAVDRLGAFDAE